MSFSRLMLLMQTHSKMSDLNYSKLEIPEYLKLEQINTINTQGAQTLFKYRVRMANFSENFRGKNGPSACPLCGNHLDNQKMQNEKIVKY